MDLELELVGRLLLSAFLGYIIGLERELSGKESGDRTHALAALGACLFTVVSFQAGGGGDPSRIAAQVVTGLGFLGAGMILKKDNEIEGLTTAAGIWAVGAIGLAIGVGEYLLGVSAALFVGLILASERAIDLIRRRIQKQDRQDQAKREGEY